MDARFQVRKGRIELFRFQVGQRCFSDREQAQKWSGKTGETVEALETSDLEWLDGLAAATFDEALDICAMGQAAYGSDQAAKAQKSPEQLRADLDYISVMTGVELA